MWWCCLCHQDCSAVLLVCYACLTVEIEHTQLLRYKKANRCYGERESDWSKGFYKEMVCTLIQLTHAE